MPLADTGFLARMPKVELHVHLEGSVQPETLLTLARRNGVELPATSVEGLREWYRFRDFDHFVAIYVATSKCIRRPEDIELIAREFVDGQVAQNVLHTEVTYTGETIQRHCGIPWSEQLDALKRARSYAHSLGVTIDFVFDIVREVSRETGEQVAEWTIAARGEGACALGLSGVESQTPAARHQAAFQRAKAAGLKITTHAGETSGPESIWDCLELLGADRIGHGIRCLEDDALVQELLNRGTHIEVCPSSNVCLCVASSIADHPIQAMRTRGLNFGVNSDDPPMFNTNLTQEWVRCVKTFVWPKEEILAIQMRTIDAAFTTEERKAELRRATCDYHRQV